MTEKREAATLDDLLGRLKVLTYEARQVRLYLGLACALVGVAALVLVLMALGVVTVDVKVTR